MQAAVLSSPAGLSSSGYSCVAVQDPVHVTYIVT